MRVLAIDVGNTNAKIGIFAKNKLIKKLVTESNIKAITEFRAKDFDRIIISSVVPSLDDFLKEHFLKAKFIDAKSIKSLKVNLKDKKAIGADRLINAFAVVKTYSLPAAIIDFGTATTVCFIDRSATYLGGLITLGIGSSLKALNQYTAKLPLLEFKKPSVFIGKNTKSAILSGISLSHLGFIEKALFEFENNFGNLESVVFTGGYAKNFADLISNKRKVIIDLDLTLKGLYLFALEDE